MEVIEVEIDKLIPAEYNPRDMNKTEEEQLQKSLEENDFVEPIVVNKNPDRFNIIIGGHQRVKVAKKMKFVTVPVVYVDLDEEGEKKLNLRLNKNTGHWDWELLKEFDEEMLFDVGFEAEQLKMEFEEDSDVKKVPTPEAPKQAVSKFGDVYELGMHRLICGDATDIETVEALMQGKKAKCVFTDPPYNLNYDFANNGMVQTGQRRVRFGKIKNDKMSDEDFHEFVLAAFNNMFLHMEGGASFYISGSRESTQVFNQILDEVGFHISQWLIWVKENFNISRLNYHPQHEVITHGWKKGERKVWFGDRSQTDILKFKRNIGKSVHPTEKPVDLIGYVLGNSCKAGWPVFDPFAGSGSTIMACEQLKMPCYSLELDPIYVDVIVKRWENFTGQKANKLLINLSSIKKDKISV